MLSYSHGEDDVGLWRGEKLVKLCSAFPEAFLMSKHKEFYFDPKVHELYIPVQEEKHTFMSEMTDTDMIENGLSDKVANLYSDSLDPRSFAVNHEDFDREFFKTTSTKTDEDKVLAWNKTESVIMIQRHVLKHRNSENKTSFGVEKILKCQRDGFQPPGPLEKASIQLLEASIAGNVETVEELMVSGQVHPDVSDKNGHTALIGATVSHILLFKLINLQETIAVHRHRARIFHLYKDQKIVPLFSCIIGPMYTPHRVQIVEMFGTLWMMG